MKRLICLSACALTLAACDKPKTVKKKQEGSVVTAEFLRDYNGTFTDNEQGESIEILPSGVIRAKHVRQVGTEGTDIPYPTTCTYIEEGHILGVYRRFEARRASYMNYADHMIKVSVTKVFLDKSAGAKQESLENCQKFESRKSRVGKYSWYVELLNNYSFRMHTSGGADYDGKVRTQSTLDEVFTRVKTASTNRPTEEDFDDRELDGRKGKKEKVRR